MKKLAIMLLLAASAYGQTQTIAPGERWPVVRGKIVNNASTLQTLESVIGTRSNAWNGKAETSITNGFVTASITNGMGVYAYRSKLNYGDVTNQPALAGVPNAWPQSAITGTVTWVTASITNGLASTDYVSGQGYVTASITNGLGVYAYRSKLNYGDVTNQPALAGVPNAWPQSAITGTVTWVTADYVSGQGYVSANVSDITIGNSANGANNGVGLGYGARGNNYGVAVGYDAVGNASGVGVGFNAYGPSGVAVGYNAIGDATGVAVGFCAYGPSGVAVGYYASSGGLQNTAEIGTGNAISNGWFHYRGNPVLSGDGTTLQLNATNATWQTIKVLVPGGATNTIRYLGLPPI